MVKSKTVKCGHRIDPRNCRHGERIDSRVRCYLANNDLRAWYEHPERRSDSPMKPSSNYCSHPELFGTSLTKNYKRDLEVPGPPFVVSWSNTCSGKKIYLK